MTSTTRSLGDLDLLTVEALQHRVTLGWTMRLPTTTGDLILDELQRRLDPHLREDSRTR